jgi:hypothetical protein
MFLSEWREFRSAPCLAGEKKLDDSSGLDVVEIARVCDMLPSLFPSCLGQGLISTTVNVRNSSSFWYYYKKHHDAGPLNVKSPVVMTYLV